MSIVNLIFNQSGIFEMYNISSRVSLIYNIDQMLLVFNIMYLYLLGSY